MGIKIPMTTQKFKSHKRGTYCMSKSFSSGNRTLANITCQVHAKFKYSRYFKTKAETKLSGFCF